MDRTTDRQTDRTNFTFMWGSLRLAPIILEFATLIEQSGILAHSLFIKLTIRILQSYNIMATNRIYHSCISVIGKY